MPYAACVATICLFFDAKIYPMPEPKYKREDYQKAREGGILGDLTDHLSELRDRIIVSVVLLIVVFVIAFNYAPSLIDLLQQLAPEGSSFIQLKPGEVLMTSIKVAIYAALVLAMPIVLYQVAEFLKPGLKENEAKVITPILFTSPLLFWLGMGFAYFFTLPPLLGFLLGFGKDIVEARYGLEHFINLELSILSICGLSFQLPVLIITLAQLGLVKVEGLLKLWRYVVLGAFCLAAVITPTPDPMTMTIVASALIGLYFVTVGFLKMRKG